jgi:dephospho-CoA kinase
MMDKYIFAITGGSGVGKSTVSDIFRSLGVYVSDADKTARLVTQKGSMCLTELIKAFGSDIVDSDGNLKRRHLGSIVFSDSKKLDLLNKITHKYIKEYTQQELNGRKEEICAIDGAVIKGSPVENLCRCFVTVVAKKDIRAMRISERDNINLSSALQRIDAQISDEEYISFSDFVIENNGDLGGLKKQIEQVYSKIKDRAKETPETE